MYKKSDSKELVSIIIAAYNEEKYIKRCLESVQKQTYKNIEIIVVNDGSTDNTEQICKEFSKKDSRIKYFSQENMGLPRTREKGLKEARGKYIQFIDSDDWCELNRTEALVEAIEKNDADIVFSSAYRHREDGIAVICNLPIGEGCYSVDELKSIYLKPLFGDMKKDKLITTGYVWCCLYKKKVVENISFFDEIVLHEDEIINLQAMNNSKKICVISDPLYNYNRRLNTLSKKNTYWKGYWENMSAMYYVKMAIGKKIFVNDDEYIKRLSTSMYQKFLRTIRNEVHYDNPAKLLGGLKNIHSFATNNDVLEEAKGYVDLKEFTVVERMLVECIMHKMYIIPYFYYAFVTNRMRNFQEKTKN